MRSKKVMSIAQDELAEMVAGMFPYSSVTQEVPISKLIAERGYSIGEIGRELGHKPHRMFVDIVMMSSDDICCFEYQGEQHYMQVGNMSASNNALLWNQQLDEEKHLILSRIGIPLVQVPFDEYVDESILDHKIATARCELEEFGRNLIACESCQRYFPVDRLEGGICDRCANSEDAHHETSYAYDKYGIPKGMYGYDDDIDDDDVERSFGSDGDSKEQTRRIRKERYRAFKSSNAYKEMKEEARRRRKEQYLRMKAERKRKGGQNT